MMCHRANLWLLAALLVCPIAAKGQVVIDLVPRDAGPFLGGETVTVDVIAQNTTVDAELPLLLAQVDFTDSNPALSFDGDFQWALIPRPRKGPRKGVRMNCLTIYVRL